MATSTCLIKGRTSRREFSVPFQQYVEMLEKIDVCVTQSQALDLDTLDFVLFFQSYPHEFSQSELTHLRRVNPLAPFFFVLGVCCEGMLRTAGPLDSPFYCYAHGWSNKEIEQIRLFLTDQPSVFSLPLTAESDEIALWQNPLKVATDLRAVGRR